LYSTRKLSNIIFSDFEDAFLYDGERQLKIRYNPKLGNIKTNLSEPKVDTIGYKYPFFFRNSEVNYKEFTISGLLSFLGDEKFFYFFNEISKIPRRPGNEGKIADYLVKFAIKRNLEYYRDKYNNVIIWKKASKGYEYKERYDFSLIKAGEDRIVVGLTERKNIQSIKVIRA
jgi:hypothetical protein